jgi:hypothetical protein
LIMRAHTDAVRSRTVDIAVVVIAALAALANEAWALPPGPHHSSLGRTVKLVVETGLEAMTSSFTDCSGREARTFVATGYVPYKTR